MEELELGFWETMKSKAPPSSLPAQLVLPTLLASLTF